jgi:hypothetical protein
VQHSLSFIQKSLLLKILWTHSWSLAQARGSYITFYAGEILVGKSMKDIYLFFNSIINTKIKPIIRAGYPDPFTLSKYKPALQNAMTATP